MDMLLQQNNNEKNLTNNISNNVGEMQSNFITSTLGNIINSAIDTGLKIILPDFIENNVIDVKNAILGGGIEGGLNSLISNVIDVGKNALGMMNQTFSNLNQYKDVLNQGGLIETIGNAITDGINAINNSELLNENDLTTLKNEKDIIVSEVNNKIDINFKSQMNSLEKIQGYCNKWDKYYNNNQIDKMEKMYNKIMNEKEKLLPLEYLLNKINQIENIQNLIKNNGNNLELSSVQMALAERLY